MSNNVSDVRTVQKLAKDIREALCSITIPECVERELRIVENVSSNLLKGGQTWSDHRFVDVLLEDGTYARAFVADTSPMQGGAFLMAWVPDLKKFPKHGYPASSSKYRVFKSNWRMARTDDSCSSSHEVPARGCASRMQDRSLYSDEYEIEKPTVPLGYFQLDPLHDDYKICTKQPRKK